jgi:hypothetical protein
MDQTTLTDAAYEASDTLEQMAEGATETPALAAFLAETAQLLRTLAQRIDTDAHDLAAANRRRA